MELRIKNIFLFFVMGFFFGQNLSAEKTTVSCENKTNKKLILELEIRERNSGGEKLLSVDAGKSNNNEWTSEEFLVGVTVNVLKPGSSYGKVIGSMSSKVFGDEIGRPFERNLEGKYKTGPRTVNIVVTNYKITTVITDSEGKNSETIVKDIKPPLIDKKTVVTCENKTNKKLILELEIRERNSGGEKLLSVDAGKSNNNEWTSEEFLVGVTVNVLKPGSSYGKVIGSMSSKVFGDEIGRPFECNLEGKYATGPRTVKIVVTNDKITTVITDSKGKNPETITTHIKPPLA